jgi:hypothetical protein
MLYLRVVQSYYEVLNAQAVLRVAQETAFMPFSILQALSSANPRGLRTPFVLPIDLS